MSLFVLLFGFGMVEFVMGYRFALYVGRFALLVVRTALPVSRDVHHAGPYQVMAGYLGHC